MGIQILIMNSYELKEHIILTMEKPIWSLENTISDKLTSIIKLSSIKDYTTLIQKYLI